MNEQTSAKYKEELLAVYAKLRERVQKTLSEVQGVVTGETVKSAVEKAGQELRDVGEHSREVITKATDTLRKDLASTSEMLRPRLEELAEDSEKAVATARERGGVYWREMVKEGERLGEIARDKGGAWLASMTKVLGEWAMRQGERLDETLVYRAGETTHGGTFTCTGCGKEVVLDEAGDLPACPNCQGTEFRRA